MIDIYDNNIKSKDIYSEEENSSCCGSGGSCCGSGGCGSKDEKRHGCSCSNNSGKFVHVAIIKKGEDYIAGAAFLRRESMSDFFYKEKIKIIADDGDLSRYSFKSYLLSMEE